MGTPATLSRRSALGPRLVWGNRIPTELLPQELLQSTVRFFVDFRKVPVHPRIDVTICSDVVRLHWTEIERRHVEKPQRSLIDLARACKQILAFQDEYPAPIEALEPGCEPLGVQPFPNVKRRPPFPRERCDGCWPPSNFRHHAVG